MLQKTLKVIVLLFVTQVNSLDTFLRAQSVLYGLSSLTETIDRNTTCLREFYKLYEEVDLKHYWALKVLDASGQPESGFLWGNNLWLGSHFRCTDLSNQKPLEISYEKVKHPEPTPFDYPPYPLAFTVAYLQHNSTLQQHTQMPLEMNIELGLCVPESCDVKELQMLLRKYLDKRYLQIQQFYELNIEILKFKILNKDPWISLTKTIVGLSICCITLCLVLIGTLYDVNVIQPRLRSKQRNLVIHQSPISVIQNIKRSENDNKIVVNNNNNNTETDSKTHEIGIFEKILKCFSIYSNTKALIRTKMSTDSIASVHGVRLFSLIWVICVHSVFYQVDFLENVPTGFRLSEYFLIQVLGNSTYCVDSFLFLSGFLVSYAFYKSKKNLLDSKAPTNIIIKITEFFSMFIHRYLRLTPVYLITIILSDMLFTYYRQTSALDVSEQPDINCPQYWWRNLLYVNNFYPRSEMCLSWSWYLSADTQFFVLTSALLILSTMFFKIAASVSILCIAGCVVITGYRSYAVGYIPTMDEQLIQLDAIYDLPWNRIGPYLIGVITGYVLTIKLDGKLKIKKPYLVILWIVFPMINLWILFTLYGRQISVEFSAVYMGISRTLWGFGLAWLFIACCTNNAGIVNKFLSFRGWIPFSRLTYCCYLLNPLLINIMFLGAESSQNASLASFTLTIFGTTLLTFFMAFWYSLLFESPYILLTKLLFGKLTRRKVSKNSPA